MSEELKATPNPDYDTASHRVWFFGGTEPVPEELCGDGATPHNPYKPINIGPEPKPLTQEQLNTIVWKKDASSSK